jgi:S1-C subfamily serine protease
MNAQRIARPIFLLSVFFLFSSFATHWISCATAAEQDKSLTVPDVVKKVRPSVVTILTRGVPVSPSQAQSGSGSGVIIDESGYILTNNHLVTGTKRFDSRDAHSCTGNGNR